MNIRPLVLALLTLVLVAPALVACGQQQAPATDGKAAPPPEPGSVVLGSTRNMPDWLFILRTNEGGTIHFNQRTITRQNGLADIWLQVHYGQPQLYQTDTESQERVVHYELERLHYRFNCTDNTFLVVERQIMGANEQIIATDVPRQIWRDTPEQGAARQVLPIACRGA